jgi:hypothetical protein
MNKPYFSFSCLMLLFSMLLPLQAFGSDKPDSGYEDRMLLALQNIQSLNNDQALKQTREIIQNYPTSKLAQLLYADLLMAKTAVLSNIGSGIPDNPEKQPRLNDLTFEIKQRLSSIKTPAM